MTRPFTPNQAACTSVFDVVVRQIIAVVLVDPKKPFLDFVASSTEVFIEIPMDTNWSRLNQSFMRLCVAMNTTLPAFG